MLKLRTILLSILFAAFALAHADSEWKQYPYQAPGSDILFPQDEGRHIMFPNLEWWYLVIHAKGETTGHDYSILVTHFNNKFRFFSISDINEGTHLNHTALSDVEREKFFPWVFTSYSKGISSPWGSLLLRKMSELFLMIE